MTPEQAAEILDVLSAANVLGRLDPRGPDLWDAALAPLDFNDAMQAAARLIQTQQWVKVADLTIAVRAMRANRAPIIVDDGDPDETPQEFLERRRAMERAAGDGRYATATPLTAIGRAPACGPDHLTEDDVRAMRQQKDLLAYMRKTNREERDANTRRRALVLRHPDLAARLTEPPINHTTPERWTGSIGASTWNGAINACHIHTAFVAIVHEAEQREARAHQGTS